MSGKVREDAGIEVVEALIEVFHLLYLFFCFLLAHCCESGEGSCCFLQKEKDSFLVGPEKNAFSLIIS